MGGWWLHGLAALGALAVYFIPSPVDPKPYIFPYAPPALTGPLNPNTKLQKAERLFEGVVIGPESYAADGKGHIFTGAANGNIWSFDVNGHNLRMVTHTGVNHSRCGTPLIMSPGSFDMEDKCGRPKGMKFDKDGHLIVVDSYIGLLKVNTETGHITTLVSSKQGADGTPFTFLNSLDISTDGTIYFTDSSTKWDRAHHRMEVLETNNFGRLLAYDPKSRRVQTLLAGLYLANGIALSHDETFIVIAEMSICRLTKYYLKGVKAGQKETLLDNLPGYPDNVKRTSKGTFYAGLPVARFRKRIPPFLDLIAPYPALKRFIAKVTPLILYNVFLPKHALFIEVDSSGRIVDSVHDPTGSVVHHAGEAFEHAGHIYIGHYAQPFVAVLKTSDVQN